MITAIINEYRLANTYIVELENDQVALVDLGGPSIDSLVDWLGSKNKKIGALFLTHEHADHCVGLLKKDDLGDFPVYCSNTCGQNIANKRLNFSLYSDDIETFEANIDYTPVNDLEVIEVAGYFFKVLHTPGHSPGSVCIQVNEDIFFTGDTLLNGVKTLLTLPSSSKEDFKTSIEKLEKFMKTDQLIYPGHGDKFHFNGWYL